MDERRFRKNRPTDDSSLLELSGALSDEEAESMRDAIRERETASRARLDHLTDGLDL